MEFSLLGAAAVAVSAMLAVLRFESGRTNAAECTRDVWEALVASIVVGLVAGRLVAMITAGSNPLASPGDILIVRGGVDTIGAVLAGLVSFAVAVRADLWDLADAAAPAAITGLAGWHGGCLVRDACLGTPSDLPWAMSQAGSAITRHPVEIYAALILLAIAVGLVLWKRRPRPAGLLAAMALAGGATARLVTEPMRPGLGSDLVPWYAVAAGGAFLLALWRGSIGGRDPAE